MLSLVCSWSQCNYLHCFSCCCCCSLLHLHQCCCVIQSVPLLQLKKQQLDDYLANGSLHVLLHPATKTDIPTATKPEINKGSGVSWIGEDMWMFEFNNQTNGGNLQMSRYGEKYICLLLHCCKPTCRSYINFMPSIVHALRRKTY